MTIPVLKLKRGEDRRLRAGHLWIFSNEVDTAATPLTQFEPGAAVQVHSDRDQFLGHAYVNPRTLIAARIVGRDAAYPLDPSLLVHRLRVALSLRERLYRGTLLSPGVRRVRRTAGPGARSLRRHRGGAERHGRHRPAARRHRSRGEQGDPREDHRVEKRLRRARARRPGKDHRRLGWRRMDRGTGRSHRARAGRGVRRAACRRPENRLVLRSGRQSRAAASLPAVRRARARCVQLRGRMGRVRTQGRRRQRDLRGFLRDRARLRRAQRARQWRERGDGEGRRLRCAESTAGERCAIRRGDSRSARVRQAQEGRAAGAGRVSQAEPARAAAHRSRWAAGVLFVLLPHGRGRARDARSRPRRDTPADSCRCWSWAASRPITRCIRRFRKPVISNHFSAASRANN